MFDIPARRRLIKITHRPNHFPKVNPVSACWLQGEVHLASLVFKEQTDVGIDRLAVVDAQSQILRVIAFVGTHEDVSTIGPHDAAILSFQKRLCGIQNVALQVDVNRIITITGIQPPQ